MRGNPVNEVTAEIESLRDGSTCPADSKNNRVQKVDPEGKLILSFTGENIPECGF